MASAKRKPKTVKVDGENVYRSRSKAFRSLEAQGRSGSAAGKIANAGRTFRQRSRMAKKGWRTRKGGR